VGGGEENCLQIQLTTQFLQSVARGKLEQDCDRIELVPTFQVRDAQMEAIALMLHTEFQQDASGNRLFSTGRFKAIDSLRRRFRFDASLSELALKFDTETGPIEIQDDDQVEDDRLRLIFTCCHPALSPEAQVALTLREVCGLTTEEIASAFLIAPPTLAQRIVRAKAKIRDAGIPYQVPSRADLPEQLDTVLQVIYLVFNEGYAASSGTSLTRTDLSGEAIRLGRLQMELLPDYEGMGLLALMLLQESRRVARTSSTGDLNFSGRPRSVLVELRPNCRRECAGATGVGLQAVWNLYDSGRDRVYPCSCL
jgi:predicted RNA polymerase sigma factor